MRCVVFALALVAAACSSNPKSSSGDGGGGAAGSGGGSDMASAPRPDLGIAGIACGNVACTTTVQFCCSGDSGKSGDCEQTQNPTCAAAQFHCDGPEDCEPANPICCVEGGIAACRPGGYCESKASTTHAAIMCHSVADCPGGYTCVGAPNGSPYALCLIQ
jgi:hypothetical protein